jgi:N-acetylglucosaminyldiphosphoundecaprenol N-acetyl-beta-D-mannosaminyltransferase
MANMHVRNEPLHFLPHSPLGCGHVLGAPLLVTDYDRLAAQCLQWARAPRCVALEFVNTHIVAMRRHDAAFCAVLGNYDYLVPDGMPLVWCLNRAGAGMRDRVYGPTFMRRFLETAPSGSTHYLLGGSEDCGARLREIFTRRNSGLKFVGSFHGRCGEDGLLEGTAEREVIEEINRLAPEFIWVGFGTPKQQAWVRQHKLQIQRGVVLTVGRSRVDAAGGVDLAVSPGLRTTPTRAALLEMEFALSVLPGLGRRARPRVDIPVTERLSPNSEAARGKVAATPRRLHLFATGRRS